MIIQKAQLCNIEDIIEIIEQAKQYFKEEKILQWYNGYPSKEDIRRDIDKEESYIVLDKDKIVATFVLSVGEDESYKKIYDGEWITNNKIYCTIHRFAIHNDYKRKGIGSLIINYSEKFCENNSISSLRIDTKKFNIPMINLIEKNDFTYCGIIKTEDNDNRVAYEKIVKNNV